MKETIFPPLTMQEHVPVMPEPGTRFRHNGITFVLEGYEVSDPRLRPSIQGPRMLTLRFVEVPDAIPRAEY